jgi:hypothetical protein
MTKYAISISTIVEVDNFDEAYVAADVIVDFLKHHYLAEDPHHWNVEELEDE